MNSKRAAEIREDIRWQEITPGGAVYEGGTASAVKTGDWRVMRRSSTRIGAGSAFFAPQLVQTWLFR